MDDLYKILGVPSSASADEIKKAYREAAFKYHPDRNAGDSVAEDKFKKISAAYSVLGDETKRAEYDRYGSTDEYARAASYTRQYGQTGQAYAQDPFGADFWTWYEQAMNAERAHGSNSFYRTSYTYEQQSEQSETKRDALVRFIRSALTFAAGLIFLRYSWILLPFGPILCLAAVVNGFTGALRSIRILLSPKIK
ncbi:DnaJ domain-containing protein [Treponema lecithinolyticum]|uniref:DnaJ domain-containing protein n=1 Tax=Treponema lecithinolyticum TaxID=53418 RepID=UPI00360A3EE0